LLSPHLFRGICLSAILGVSFGHTAVIMPYDFRTPFRHMDTNARMPARMMDDDVSRAVLGVYPYVQL
jgi:hypothetical protein